MDSKSCSLSFPGDKAGMPKPAFSPAFSYFAALRETFLGLPLAFPILPDHSATSTWPIAVPG